MSKRGMPKLKQKEYVERRTRLGYKRTEADYIESKSLLLGSRVVFVQIDPWTNTYRVVDRSSPDICYFLGKADTVEACKREVRKRLIRCSSSIYEEVRVTPKKRKSV